MVCICSVCSR